MNDYSKIFRHDSLKEKFEEIDNTIQIAEVTLSADDIIAMYTTPIEVIPNQAGKVIEVLGCTVIFDYGTVQFTGGGNVTLNTTTTGTALTGALASAVVKAAADSVTTILPIAATLTNGKGVSVTNATAVFGAGDGVIRLKVAYTTHTTEL